MFLDEVADYLSTSGIGTVGTDLFKSRRPEAPDACVTVYETGGMAPARAMTGTVGQVVEECAGLQVVARAATYAAARLKVNDVLLALDGLGDVNLSGTRYSWVSARQSPFPMGFDEQDRALVAVNFDVYKARTTE